MTLSEDKKNSKGRNKNVYQNETKHVYTKNTNNFINIACSISKKTLLSLILLCTLQKIIGMSASYNKIIILIIITVIATTSIKKWYLLRIA